MSPGNRKLESNEVDCPRREDELMLEQAIMLVQGMRRHRGDGQAQIRRAGRVSRPQSSHAEGDMAAAGVACS